MASGELVQIPTSDLVRNLKRMGVDERTIAASAGITVSEVRTITRTTFQLSPADEELANAMRTLAWTAFEEAMQTLIYGSPADKQALVRAIIGRTMGLVGMTVETSTHEMRNKMEELLEGIKELPDGAATSPSVVGVDNPDEGS